MANDHVPLDMITIILSFLPVKPLLLLRLVCRQWRDLIDSPNFVNLHLSRSLHRHVIIRDTHLHSIPFHSLDPQNSVTTTRIDHDPLRCRDYGTEVWGSYNGLSCLSNKLNAVAVWNFSTRKYRVLPYAPVEFEDMNYFLDTRIYGFGYDEISDDYKIVRVFVLKTRNGVVLDNEVKIYSMKSHTWHSVQRLPNIPDLKRTGGVFAGGCLHWIVVNHLSKSEDGKIVAFDIAREVFGYIDQPDYTDTKFGKGLHCLDGCLSISCDYDRDCFEVWVMKEYGVKESWTKLLSIIQTGFTRPFIYMHPITYSKNGRELLLEQDSDKFVWYDMENNTDKSEYEMEKKKMRFVEVQGVRGLMELNVCVESLISPNVVDE